MRYKVYTDVKQIKMPEEIVLWLVKCKNMTWCICSTVGFKRDLLSMIAEFELKYIFLGKIIMNCEQNLGGGKRIC